MRWLEADGGRSFLRALPVLSGSAPLFEIGDAPAEPLPLFTDWIEQAAQAGVPEPHAMTISTVDAEGLPRARVLILKAIDRDGWHFAASSASQKGRDLSAHPAAALTFHWPEVVRQVRVVGAVVNDGAQASAADFLGRPIGSRAMALTLRQSEPLVDPAEIDAEIEKAHRKLADDPELVPEEWVSYAVQPTQLEFWQGSPDRKHQRLSYQRVGDGWERTQLWP
ncbi:pyridoxine/pyridoxamine 5'-phosphate oxidase [Mycobacteroides franklinii]|uniref:Pyridoxine/pyridoxamine 5'-phosphate oxidase n=1 Tax=Mycobacteroides franklinii TaxID=948102 RepID=A0A4R8R3Q3_9MYCO|nr:pyridoxal 5'-phosphate synthase [Mycobacteroides franklinii]TDZ43449.1 Pyridoxine/pyridoxamine 5'-phosphate oxidase [Mycobacteroides franklinii]TDZ50584.1 Pyridoxine/pyridoxamine 5'-phosphate oxidase [Mycobacteroides franklinii]TDZ57004.1 Pyridoxine/pyridoxamine 5'-phosphate oxidase [Mycobacteroides franklinii]TDZ63945.1 Pyridoxine/pyridoxamine 5'-phosphate oxidase [Mycobacteroides franklinii]TDZ70342.1 Pyridoxine/pyridoxamine 5'-phosphate oxidase [Mycobacteroides franklinii]